MTIEEKTADALLERQTSLAIGASTYQLSPPTLATLIAVSADLSTLPDDLLTPAETDEAITITALRSARHASGISHAISLLILGAEAPTHNPLVRLWRSIRGDRVGRLARTLSHKHSPRELALAFIQLTQRLEVSDFFALTAFLSALRITKEGGATARGHSSPAHPSGSE